MSTHVFMDNMLWVPIEAILMSTHNMFFMEK